jgi:hypothetical protein
MIRSRSPLLLPSLLALAALVPAFRPIADAPGAAASRAYLHSYNLPSDGVGATPIRYRKQIRYRAKPVGKFMNGTPSNLKRSSVKCAL